MRCPRCGGPTGPWSGYLRHLREDVLHRIFVPRVRCRCGLTAALLPWFVTPYRWDSVDVIGAALELAVGGQGVRRIAAALGRPRRPSGSGAGASGGWPGRSGRPARGGGRDGLVGLRAADVAAPGAAAVAALASAWTRRHGPVEPWRLAALITGGTLARSQHDLALGTGDGLPCDGRDIPSWR